MVAANGAWPTCSLPLCLSLVYFAFPDAILRSFGASNEVCHWLVILRTLSCWVRYWVSIGMGA